MSTDGTQVTPNRRTHVVFDTPIPSLLQMPWCLERQAHQMCRSNAAQLSNMKLRKGFGWTLAHYGDSFAYAYERTDGQSGWLTATAGTLTVASGLTEGALFAKLTNTVAPNVNPSANVATTGATVYQKRVGDGVNWDVCALTADASAFPRPDSSNEDYPMDRVAISTSTYSAEGVYGFTFAPYGALHRASDGLATWYFPGPAGSDKFATGTGNYALKFYGDGLATLFERVAGSTSWVSRTTFRYCNPGTVFGNNHFVRVFATSKPGYSTGPAGALVFECGADAASNVIEAVQSTIVAAQTGHHQQEQTRIYAIPQLVKAASVDCPIRVDIRRDLRGIKFGVYVPKFFTSGYLIDDDITTPQWFTQAADFTIYYDAYVPGDSTLTFDLQTSDGSSLTSTGSGTNYVTFQVPAWSTGGTPRGYRLKVSATSTSDQSKSPVLKMYRMYRDGQAVLPSTTPFELRDTGTGPKLINKAPLGVEIMGPEKDPTHEQATVHAFDLSNGLTTLRARGSIQMRIETEYDPNDASKRMALFSGYTTRVTSGRRSVAPDFGTTSTTFPTTPSWDLMIQASGMWGRLEEQTYFGVQQQFFDTQTGLPWKVTDVISQALQMAGFPASMIDLTASPILLWGQGSNDRMTINPLTNLADFVRQLLSDYLGQAIVFDPNIGTYGKWRNIVPPTAPYTNVAAFVTTMKSSASGKHLVHNVDGYPLANTLGDGLTYTTTAPTIFINKGTYHSYVVPPEGNLVHVSAVGSVTPNGPSQLLSASIPNPKSFDFDPDHPTADPTHPDYLGRMVPIFYMNPALISVGDGSIAQNAVSWMARRIYDVACHAIKMVSFQAPIVPLVHEKDGTRRRSLLYYDPVSVDGQQYLVRNVNPAYDKDGRQMQMVELEAPRF